MTSNFNDAQLLFYATFMLLSGTFTYRLHSILLHNDVTQQMRDECIETCSYGDRPCMPLVAFDILLHCIVYVPHG